VVASLALDLAGEPDAVQPAPQAIVDGLRDEHAALWLATPAVLPALGAASGFIRKLGNARAARRLLDAVADEALRRPPSPADAAAWRERVCGRLEQFGRERLGWSESFTRLLLGDDFFVSSTLFVREARAFWPPLTLEQLGQALRNVWIGNWLQLLCGRRVALRPGLFAYSMLYPLTDNLLDDEAVSAADKRAFGQRFGLRLAGRAVEARGRHESAVFELVRRIEDEYPRRAYPGVHARLLAIHEAQSWSLRQHHGEDLADGELLSLTVAKGGSSVLADLHLVTGRPSRREERFAFGYGVFLQLLDDLQDVEQDLAAGHETLFTRAARRGALDQPVARLAAFIDRVLDGHGLFAGPEFEDRKDLVRRNCRALLVGSVAEHERRFTRGFRRGLQRQWPLSFGACRRLRRRAALHWMRATAHAGPRALESLLDAAIGSTART
jgi:hypothetical protein